MRFSSFILRNLARRPVRSLITVAGIGLAIGAVVAMIGVAEGFRRSFVEMYERRGVDLVVTRAGTGQSLTAALDQHWAETIAKLPGVRDVAPQLSDAISLDQYDLYGVLVQGWQIGDFLFDAVRVVDGRPLDAHGQREILIGKVLARNLDKGVGDELEVVEDEPYRIVGIFESFNVYENNSILMRLDELQRLMDRPQQVNGFTVRVDDATDPQAVVRLQTAIENLGHGLSAMPASDYVQSTHQIMLARSMATITSAVVLILGMIGMLNTMIMSVFERTREIGVLRALGWRKRRIVGMILCEAELLSLAGALLGCVAAALLVAALGHLRQTSGLVQSRLGLDVLALGPLVAVVVGLLGGLYPAYRGARMLPTEALRHE